MGSCLHCQHCSVICAGGETVAGAVRIQFVVAVLEINNSFAERFFGQQLVGVDRSGAAEDDAVSRGADQIQELLKKDIAGADELDIVQADLLRLQNDVGNVIVTAGQVDDFGVGFLDLGQDGVKSCVSPEI